MAKKKTSSRGRGKKKNNATLITLIKSLKQLGTSALIAVVMLVGIVFAYDYLSKPSNNKDDNTEETTQKVAKESDTKKEQPVAKEKKETKKQESTVKKSDTKSFKVPVDLELPKMLSDNPEQIIKHDGYTVSYNSDYKIANWVAYELTPEEATSKKTERSNKFVPDPMVKSATALNEDYTKTGYDRGHLAPAGDMKWSQKAMMESFYFSNITPQKPSLNRGIWKVLEEQARLWAADYGSIYIATGPVIEKDLKRLGKNRVGIPKQFYKVLVYVKNGQYEGIGFLFDNKDYKKNDTNLKGYAVPIDSVEVVTKIDFFPAIPDSEEAKMESQINWKAWEL